MINARAEEEEDNRDGPIESRANIGETQND